ncbi:MAG: radical SAM protein [Actinobacteria bacterium]|nr:MAG: radical SAM protein [Actinomycetota bacterium]
MKLTIIQPYHKSNVKLFGKVYMSMLTLPVLASLCPDDVEVDIIDENIEPINFSKRTDAVCISSITSCATRAYEIADYYKQKDVPVILGGIHPTMIPQEAALHSNAVVIGEAEPIWNTLIKDLKNKRLKKFYHADAKANLSNLPIPRHDLANKTAYVNIPKVETSRGCPFNCSFCSTTRFFGNIMRYRPVEEVIKEVRGIDTNFVFFTDNNIVGNPRFAKKLFKELAKLNITWISQSSLNLANDDELLKLAAKSGCVGMLVGFESLSKESIKSAGKTVNKVDNYSEQIKKIHNAGISFIGCFVLGFDDDKQDVFKKTEKFIRKNHIEIPQLTVLTPFPGTDLRDEIEKEGRLLHNDWQRYDACHVTFKPKKMTAKQLRQKYDKLCKKIYSYPSIFRRVLSALLRHKSIYKSIVVCQVNVVYRRLWQVTVGDDADL